MDGLDARLPLVAWRGIRSRLILVVWCLGVMPSVPVLVNVALGASSRPWLNGLGLGLAFTVLCGGQAWRSPARVRALLDDGEKLLAAFPVGPDRLSPLRRLMGAGGFLVVTNRRVLVFSHNKIPDVVTGLVWSAPRRECSAELDLRRRRLTVVRGEERHHCRFGFGARRRTAVERFVVAINRGWW
ncbi:hypothetical protein ACWGH5_27640 [Streptomyces sp. NPDC054864]